MAKLEGTAIRFESWSQDLGGFRERLMPGSLDATLRDHPDVRALVEHDVRALLARTSARTLRLRADRVGLHFDLDLPRTRIAEDLAEHVELGNVAGMSFGFSMVGGENDWDEAPDGALLRTITRVGRLHEISAVSDPAYLSTAVSVRGDETVGDLIRDAGAREREQLRFRLGLGSEMPLEAQQEIDRLRVGVGGWEARTMSTERASLTVGGIREDRSATLKRGQLAVGRKLLRDAQRAHRLGRSPKDLTEAQRSYMNAALDADAEDVRRRTAELAR